MRAARRSAGTAEEFVEGGYRAFFEFIVEDPERFAFMRRNLDTLRDRFGDAVLPAGTEELAEDLRAAIAAGHLPPVDVEYCAHAMIAVGLELGTRLAERDAARRRGRHALRLRALPRRARAARRRYAERLTTLAEARRLFSPETAYLNTATYGLPPRPAIEAFDAAMDEWRHGRTPGRGWDESVGAARELARLHGVPAADVAVGGSGVGVRRARGAVARAGARVSRGGGLHLRAVAVAAAAGLEVEPCR